MPELEDRLRALAADLEWPQTPDLAGAVAPRIAAGGERRRRRRPRRLALALALALLVPAGGALAFPSARDDVLEWLGLKGATITRSPDPPAARWLSLDDLGRAVSLAEAERLAGFRPVVPRTLGAPREVRFDPRSRFVTLVYDDVLVAQARGALDSRLVSKTVSPGIDVRPVTVGGEPGVFVDGTHNVLYRHPGGGARQDPPRLAQRALVFNRGDVLVRIEGERLTLPSATALARSLR